jgi:membrane protein
MFRRGTKALWLIVQFGGIRRALGRAYRDVIRHHTLQVSAALSYYFVLSVFPALIALSAILGLLPLPDIFGRLLLFMGQLLPRDAMRIVYSVLGDVFSSHRGTWLTFGTLGILWTTSSAFDAMIEALDIAYDAEETRPLWKTRLLAIGLAFMSGGLLLSALGVMMVGPRFGDWLAARLSLSAVFAAVWPFLRWAIAISFTVLATELLYFLAPNVKQRFAATLPGALLSVTVWNGLSLLLGVYFRHFANFNRVYGTLGGFIALMTWLYWTSFVLLVGAELNAELAKESRKGCVEPKAGTIVETGPVIQPRSLDRAA